MVYGSLPPPRIDQQISGSSAGGDLLPPAQPGFFIGRLVVIGGSGVGTGFFIYTGTPGPGNVPILAITNAATDPYGNAVAAGAITDSGMPLLMYSGTPAAGSLRTSLSPAAGATTDSFGNTVEPGFFNGSLSVPGAGFVSIANGLFLFGVSSQLGPGQEAGLVAGSPTLGITELFGDLASGTDANTVIQLRSKANGGSLIINPAGLDALSYDTARKTLVGPSVQQTITSTVLTSISGLSANIGIGTYHVRCVLQCSQGGGAFAVVTAIAFSGTITSVRGWSEMVIEGAGVTVNTAHHTSFPTSFTGPAFAALANFQATIELVVVTTSTGTLAAQAAQGSATHNWFVNTNSFMEVFPVTT